MNKRFLTLTSITLIAVSLLVSSCKKVVHQNIQAASNSSVAFASYNDVFKQLNAALSFGVELDQVSTATWNLPGTLCASATLSPLGSAFPKTLTLDYGTGCIDSGGVSRSGQVTFTISGNFADAGTTADVEFVNYSVGQYTLSGEYSIMTESANGSGQPVFSETITNGIVSWGTQEIKWNASIGRTWVEGDTTNFTTWNDLSGLEDDVFELTGTGDGNDSNTHPFDFEVTTALVLPSSCKFITEGILSISPANFNTGTVDYGMGDCDKQSTIEVDGEVFNFTQ